MAKQRRQRPRQVGRGAPPGNRGNKSARARQASGRARHSPDLRSDARAEVLSFKRTIKAAAQDAARRAARGLPAAALPPPTPEPSPPAEAWRSRHTAVWSFMGRVPRRLWLSAGLALSALWVLGGLTGGSGERPAVADTAWHHSGGAATPALFGHAQQELAAKTTVVARTTGAIDQNDAADRPAMAEVASEPEQRPAAVGPARAPTLLIPGPRARVAKQQIADRAGEPYPPSAETLYRRAYRLQKQGAGEAAIDGYRQAAAADPDHAATHYNWGYVLQQKGDVEGAIAKYKETLRADPLHVWAHYNLGYLQQQTGRIDEALESYANAAALGSGNAFIFYNWGYLMERRGDLEHARNLYHQALALDPGGAAGRLSGDRLASLRASATG